MSALAAVLFDMDGTLVDTEVLWWRTTEEIAGGLGHRLTDADAPEVVGRAVEDTAAHLVRVSGGGDPYEVAAALTEGFFRGVEAGAPMRPGAQRLLTELEAEGVPFALVSASPRVVVDSVVGGSLAHVPFAFTLSADDTTRTKPHPDPLPGGRRTPRPRTAGLRRGGGLAGRRRLRGGRRLRGPGGPVPARGPDVSAADLRRVAGGRHRGTAAALPDGGGLTPGPTSGPDPGPGLRAQAGRPRMSRTPSA